MTATPEQLARLEKIRALLAKAEGTHFPGEAKAFSEKAQELMSKWAIDDAMLRASKPDEGRGSIDQSTIWIDANEYRAPKIQLLNHIAIINDCKIVLYRQQYIKLNDELEPKRRVRVVIVGFAEDREWINTLYTSLMTQASMEYLSSDVQDRLKLECPHSGHRIAWRNAFMFGYGQAIYRRLIDAKRRAQAQAETQYTGGMAMVLARKDTLVSQAFSNMFPKLGKASSSSASRDAGSAGSMGYAAGGRADLLNPKIGGNRKALDQ